MRLIFRLYDDGWTLVMIGQELYRCGVDIARPLPVSWYSVYPVLHAAWVAVAQGRWDEVDTYLEEGAAYLTPQDNNGAALFRTVASERDLVRGEPAAALSVYGGTSLDQLYEWEPPCLCWDS